MSNNLINEYLKFKRKILYDYLLQMGHIITIKDNKLWQNEEEFSKYAHGLVDNYVDKYYFDNNDVRDNPIEYSNDNIDSILLSLIDYCKKSKQSKIIINNKNEVFLLSVMMCATCYIDIASNVIDGDCNEVLNKFKFLLQYLAKVDILEVHEKRKKEIDKLFKMLTDNNEKERKFFNSIVKPDFYNSYYPYSIDFKYNIVEYNFNIKNVNNYIPLLVQNVTNNHLKELYEISFNLLELKLLEEYLGNGKVFNYIYIVDDDNINYFDKIDSEIIMKHLYLLVKNKDIDKYQQKLRKSKLNIIYEYNNLEDIPKDNKNIISVTEKLVNKDILKEWIDNNRKFIIRNKDEY